MFARTLTAPNLPVRLVMPVVTRDSALSVRWLTGGQGRETLQMMGVPDDHIAPASLEEEADSLREPTEASADQPEPTPWYDHERADIPARPRVPRCHVPDALLVTRIPESDLPIPGNAVNGVVKLHTRYAEDLPYSFAFKLRSEQLAARPLIHAGRWRRLCHGTPPQVCAGGST